MKRIILIDSSAALYRYYHSPDTVLTSRFKGESINVTALHRYASYTYRLSKSFDFDQMVHVLDPEGGSQYRLDLFPEYKAGRPPTPEDLDLQKKLLKPVLAAYQQHWIQVPGVESDDVLATLAQKYADRGDQVMIISPDKDLLQMVEDGRICIAKYKKTNQGYPIHDLIDEEGVIKLTGVRPDQIPDYLAIMGDAVDNLQGVHKAGKKTAAKWLQEYGDIYTLMTNVEQIKGKIQEHLKDAIPRLPLLRKLTSVLRDVEGVEPLDGSVKPVKPQHFEQAQKLILAKDYWGERLRVPKPIEPTQDLSSDSDFSENDRIPGLPF